MKRLPCLLALIITMSFIFPSCKKEHTNQKPTADAGMDQTVQLPVNTALLSGSGKDNDGTVDGYLWSEESGPNTAIIATNGSAATSISGLISGVYIFQLSVTDNKGATGIDTVSVNVLPAKIVTLSLQSSANPTEVHVWGNTTGLEGSTPSAPEIGAAEWTSNASPVGMRALLKFDLSSIPANATIISAKLTLFSNPTPLNGDGIHANSGTNNAMLIEEVNSSWDPTSVTWANQPNVTTTNQVVIPTTSQSFLDLVDIDVTSLISDMASNSNNGFSLRLQNETVYNSRIFCSSKYSDASKYPKLVIQYE